jgi:hypothetical protein
MKLPAFSRSRAARSGTLATPKNQQAFSPTRLESRVNHTGICVQQSRCHSIEETLIVRVLFQYDPKKSLLAIKRCSNVDSKKMSQKGETNLKAIAESSNLKK